MPHAHGSVSQARRRQRAIERGYVVPTPAGCRNVCVKEAVVDRVQAVASSLTLQHRHSMIVDIPSHGAMNAALRVRGDIGEAEFRRAVTVHKAANQAKHVWTAGCFSDDARGFDGASGVSGTEDVQNPTGKLRRNRWTGKSSARHSALVECEKELDGTSIWLYPEFTNSSFLPLELANGGIGVGAHDGASSGLSIEAGKTIRWADVADSGSEAVDETPCIEDEVDFFEKELHDYEKFGTNIKVWHHQQLEPILAAPWRRRPNRTSSKVYDLTEFDSNDDSLQEPSVPPGIFNFTTRPGFGVRDLLANELDEESTEDLHEDQHIMHDNSISEHKSPGDTLSRGDDSFHQPAWHEEPLHEGFVFMMTPLDDSHRCGTLVECVSLDFIRTLALSALRHVYLSAERFVASRASRDAWQQAQQLWQDRAYKARARVQVLQAEVNTYQQRLDRLLDNVVYNVEDLFEVMHAPRSYESLLADDVDNVFDEICGHFQTLQGESTTLKYEADNLKSLNMRLVKDLRRMAKEELENEAQMCLDTEDDETEPDGPAPSLEPGPDKTGHLTKHMKNGPAADAATNEYFSALSRGIKADAWHLAAAADQAENDEANGHDSMRQSHADFNPGKFSENISVSGKIGKIGDVLVPSVGTSASGLKKSRRGGRKKRLARSKALGDDLGLGPLGASPSSPSPIPPSCASLLRESPRGPSLARSPDDELTSTALLRCDGCEIPHPSRTCDSPHRLQYAGPTTPKVCDSSHPARTCDPPHRPQHGNSGKTETFSADINKKTGMHSHSDEEWS